VFANDAAPGDKGTTSPLSASAAASASASVPALEAALAKTHVHQAVQRIRARDEASTLTDAPSGPAQRARAASRGAGSPDEAPSLR